MNGIKKYSCPNCGKQLNYQGKKIFDPDSKYKCETCNKVFVEKWNTLYITLDAIILVPLTTSFSYFVADKINIITNNDVEAILIDAALLIIELFLLIINADRLRKIDVVELIEQTKK